MRRRTSGITLIEVLLVIAVMAIVAGLVLPGSNPSLRDQLVAAGRIVASDLDYARSLAVSYGSPSRVTFEMSDNRYYIERLGPGGIAQPLPTAALGDAGGSSTRQMIDLDNLPRIGAPPQLAALRSFGSAVALQNPSAPAVPLEFGRAGQITSGKPLFVWLSAGAGSAARYLVVWIDPVTGLAEVDAESYCAAPPGDESYWGAYLAAKAEEYEW